MPDPAAMLKWCAHSSDSNPSERLMSLQAEEEKVSEMQQMERALAQYMASVRDREEQQRCKARKIKDEREFQVCLTLLLLLLTEIEQLQCALDTCDKRLQRSCTGMLCSGCHGGHLGL